MLLKLKHLFGLCGNYCMHNSEWSPPLFHEVPFQPPDPPALTNNANENSCRQLPTTRSGRAVKPVDYYGF